MSTAAKKVRWVCPAGKHPAVLGPTRPRKENVCRYCLKCSEAAGKLVERVAPSLERDRAAAAAKAAEKCKAKEAREREQHCARLTVNGIMLEEEAWRMIGKTDVLKQLRWGGRGVPPLTIKVRRCSSSSVATYGYAWYFERRIQINDVPGLDRFDTLEVLLHELVHLVTRDGHGKNFQNQLHQASLDVWGVNPQGAYVNRYHGRYARALRTAFLDRKLAA